MKKKWISLLTLAMPYVITIFLPVLSVLFLGSTILNNYREKIITAQEVNVEAAFERTIQKIDSVENLSYILSMNDVMQKYAYACLNRSGHSVTDCLEVKDLLNTVMTNPVVEVIYLFDSRDNRVISSNAAWSNAPVYFKFSYIVEGCDPEQSMESLRDMKSGYQYRPSIRVFTNSAEKEVVEYQSAMPMGMVRRSQSQLVFAMDVEKLFSDFEEVCHAGGEIYLYDSNDTLIYGSGSAYENLLYLSETEAPLRLMESAGEEVYGMVRSSKDEEWKIKVYIPHLLGQKEMNGMSGYIWGMVVVPVIASILLSIYFTHKNHREILGILSLFRGHEETTSKECGDTQIGYGIVREYASQIIRENKRFKERMMDYEYSRKYEILDKLVRNTYKNEEEIAAALAETGFQIMEGRSVVLCLRYEGAAYRTNISEDVTIKDFVKILLDELMERQYELFDTSARETICVIAIEDSENTEIILQDMISHLHVEIAYYYGIEVTIGAGGIAETIYQLSDSYEQAKAVIRYSETSGKKVGLYSELVQLEDVYYYPREYDEKIYNYVVVGKAEEAKAFISRIYKENFEDNSRRLSVRAIELIRSRLWNCMMALAEKYEISIDQLTNEGESGAAEPLHNEKNIKSYFDMIYHLTDVLAEETGNKKKLVQNNTVSKIVNFVHENYCDNTLSLKKISYTLGFHESYISNLFKTVYGENLSVYIEKLRIEKARELMKSTDMKISEISEMVGYGTDGSFRRAFKKITGVLPGEYREQLDEKAIT